MDPADCKHEWEPCLTPPDSGSPWYRCKVCHAFGYRRQRRTKRIRPYVCAISKCRAPAVDRLNGRGPRLSYRWRCRKHLDDE